MSGQFTENGSQNHKGNRKEWANNNNTSIARRRKNERNLRPNEK
jgi:hypothetical protein